MKTVAVVGASNDRSKFGNKAVRAFRQQGYRVYPVNPYEKTIEGLQAYRSVDEVPLRPELISVYVPPHVLVVLLPEFAQKGCDELWLNPSTESPEVISEAKMLGINVIRDCSLIRIGVQPESF